MEESSVDTLWAKKFILTTKLKFPTRGFGCNEVGRHRWYDLETCNTFNPVLLYRWIFVCDDNGIKILYIPDVWRKVNGGWQIVY
jgi:hypothetical protein